MRLAIIISHPIQYNAPWFRFLAAHGLPDLRVFHLWDGGVTSTLDRGFGVPVKWDVPLLDGYDHEFVPNKAGEPGTHSVLGLNNPGLGRRVAAFQPDAILVFGYNYLTHYRFLLGKARKRIPLLFRGDSHRLVRQKGLKEYIRARWIRLVFRRFSAFLYVGRANRDYFRLHGVADRQLFLCPQAVDNEWFFARWENAIREAAEWKRQLGIPDSRKVVLFAGKFEQKKRPRDLLAAFLKTQLKDTTLVFVGNGKEEEGLRKEAAGNQDIVFVPFQNQSAMPRAYMLGDVFVLPSYGSGETWGLAVNEAMCMGRPIIVSDLVGCAQDLVHPRRNGLIFPAGDVAALGAALREALSNPNQLKTWGQQSREIIKNYSYKQATEGLVEALEFVRLKRKS